MTPYEQTLHILHTDHGWPADCAPAPEAVEEFLTVYPDATPEDVVATLEAYLDDVSAGKPRPYDFDGTARDYERRKRFLERVEFWRVNSRIALGLTTEPAVPQGRVARTVAEWYANHSEGLSYLGYPLLDPTPEGKAEMAKRLASAANPPLPWILAGLGSAAQLLIMEGELKPGLITLHGISASDPRQYAGMDAQKILDNRHAARRLGRVRAKWLEGGTLNPDWNPAWDR